MTSAVPTPNISVMIATRNRRNELHETLTKLAQLDPKPVEILICADGSTDDTVEMLRNEFPDLKVIENKTKLGSVASRDKMLRLALGEIVVSLDDDSYPIDPDFISQLQLAFQAHPSAAVITFAELRGKEATLAGPSADLTRGQFVAAYPNCAAAMRRSLYGVRAKFPLIFEHMYEEPDYALQCYAAGFGVWFEPSLQVRHYLTSTQREPISRHHRNARNELWSVVLRCPFPWIIFVALYRIVRQLAFAMSQGMSWMIREPVWWLAALRGWREVIAQRRHVPWCVYRTWMHLNRKAVRDEVELRQMLAGESSM